MLATPIVMGAPAQGGTLNDETAATIAAYRARLKQRDRRLRCSLVARYGGLPNGPPIKVPILYSICYAICVWLQWPSHAQLPDFIASWISPSNCTEVIVPISDLVNGDGAYIEHRIASNETVVSYNLFASPTFCFPGKIIFDLQAFDDASALNSSELFQELKVLNDPLASGLHCSAAPGTPTPSPPSALHLPPVSVATRLDAASATPPLQSSTEPSPPSAPPPAPPPPPAFITQCTVGNESWVAAQFPPKPDDGDLRRALQQPFATGVRAQYDGLPGHAPYPVALERSASDAYGRALRLRAEPSGDMGVCPPKAANYEELHNNLTLSSCTCEPGLLVSCRAAGAEKCLDLSYLSWAMMILGWLLARLLRPLEKLRDYYYVWDRLDGKPPVEVRFEPEPVEGTPEAELLAQYERFQKALAAEGRLKRGWYEMWLVVAAWLRGERGRSREERFFKKIVGKEECKRDLRNNVLRFLHEALKAIEVVVGCTNFVLAFTLPDARCLPNLPLTTLPILLWEASCGLCRHGTVRERIIARDVDVDSEQQRIEAERRASLLQSNEVR